MKTIYKLASLTSLLLFSSCSEMGFRTEDEEEGTGSFVKRSLLFDVRDDSEIINSGTRAGEFDDFKILFFRNNEIVPEKSYIYSEMPEIVVLPVGSYTVTATKGVDVAADWESPYYMGESDYFDIRKDNITTEIAPIVCRLQNVKVSVEFDSKLMGAMSSDSYVEVKVGDNAGLQFTAADEGRAGYYKHTDGVSLVATFRGEVEGSPTIETKSFDVVEKGYHYKIRFRLHSQSDDHSGEANADLNVDASVTTVDLENNIIVGEDEDLGDAERPKEDLGGDEPGPTPPASDDAAPTITAQAPINLEGDNEIVNGMSCVLDITSTAEGGFTKFICEIDSEKLDADELATMGLILPLNLIEPGASREPLEGLGLLEEGEEVEGKHSKQFVLTNFLPMMSALGPCTHKFILTVGDANGETTKTLILTVK